ncbi:MAG: SMP-30/gluconolactonase/LRE family protein [Chloroflexi bacterium]|nr:SMP-30/gluconolactonase/LRE family protein [Chloroflexota bacterium]
MTTPTLFAANLPFPEGPCFDRAGNLYVADFGAGNISRLAPDGQAEIFAHTGGSPTGLTFHPDGTLYVADSGLGAILRVEPDGTWSRVADGFAGPNDLTFDRAGRLYFTDPHGSSEHSPVGRVLRIDLDGSVQTLLEGMAYPNGLAFDDAGTALYVAHMRAGRVDRFSVDADGRPGRGEVFAEVSPQNQKGGCDGMAFDVEGRLYVALFRFSLVRVLAPDGTRERDISIAGDRPTNVAFGGPARRTLFITEVETSSVYTLAVPAPGLPLFAERAWPGSLRAALDR